MARFNQKVKEANKTVNYEKGTAFEHLTPQNELYARISTYLVNEPKFYGDKNEEFDRIKELISQVGDIEPQLVLQLAAYARNVLHLRSAPIMLLGTASLQKTTREFVREYTPSIVKRADELAEAISFIEHEIGAIGDEKEGTMLPHSLQKGLKLAFNNFNEYQFNKYDRYDAATSLQDVIRLVHPKSKDEKVNALYKKIATATQDKASTWETDISGGTEGKSTTEDWEKAVEKMPIMAVLRNLRNLLDKEVSSKTIDTVISKLTSEKIIQNSKQFPFRFFSACKAIEAHPNRYASKLITALDAAMFISVKNLPLISGTTAVFTDNSGSMNASISEKSTVSRKEVGAVLSAIASVISMDNFIGVFASTYQHLNFSQRDSILRRTKSIAGVQVGYNTNGYLAFEDLIRHKTKVDRIFLFSDQQCYDSSGGYDSIFDQWEQYKREVNANAYLYSFDLAGYGTTQVPEHDPHVLTIGGWSEAILKYVPMFEADKATVLAEIRKITPATYLNTRDQ
jgi:60 kDa SS-A/Ro ribonucleoprotein